MLYLHTDRNTSCNLGPMVKQSHGAGQINSSAGLSARHVDNQHCQLNACTDVTFVVSLLASVHETGANGDITYLVLSVTNCHLYDAWSLNCRDDAAQCTVNQAIAQVMGYSPKTAAQQDLSLPARRA